MTSTHYTPPPHGWRTFLIVWATQSLSVVGTGVTLFATIIWLSQTLYPHPAQKPQLALALSVVTLATVAANVFGSPIAGAWADRHDRRRTMIVTNVASGAVSLLVGFLIAAHLLQLWMLVGITIFDGLFSSFHDMAFTTSYAMIVPDKHLPRANGMMQSMISLSSILSPGIAATIIALPILARQGHIAGPLGAVLGRLGDGIPLALTLDAITFFVVAVTLFFSAIPSPQRADLHSGDGKKAKSYAEDIKEGVRYIVRRRPLLWLLAAFTVANLVTGTRGVFNPLIVKFNLEADWSGHGFTFETALALLNVMLGFGGLAGSIFVSTWGGLKRRRVYGVIVPMIISSFAQILFGLSPWLYVSAGLSFVFVAMTPILNAHSQAIWQAQTPHELQGRVFAVRRLIAQCTAPLGALLAGTTGGILNPGFVLATLGGFMFLFCIWQLFNPQLLHVEDTEYLESLAAQYSYRHSACISYANTRPAIIRWPTARLRGARSMPCLQRAAEKDSRTGRCPPAPGCFPARRRSGQD
jgi:MFS transporter, DHA3 family, macrolide efflux protein